jgi:putative transposase
MKRLQAYKFEITPNGEQIRMMRKYAGNARKVWNLALDRQEKIMPQVKSSPVPKE